MFLFLACGGFRCAMHGETAIMCVCGFHGEGDSRHVYGGSRRLSKMVGFRSEMPANSFVSWERFGCGRYVSELLRTAGYLVAGYLTLSRRHRGGVVECRYLLVKRFCVPSLEQHYDFFIRLEVGQP